MTAGRPVIALAGNLASGKTAIFNNITGPPPLGRLHRRREQGWIGRIIESD